MEFSESTMPSVWLDVTCRSAAGIDRSKIFRKVTKMGRIWGDRLTEKAVWHVVKECAKRIGVAIERIVATRE